MPNIVDNQRRFNRYRRQRQKTPYIKYDTIKMDGDEPVPFRRHK